MRFVTGTIHGVRERQESSLVSQYRSDAQWAFGRRFASFLAPLFGKNAAYAAATCRIQIMGRHAHNYEGGADRDTTGWNRGAQNRWIHTRLQTFGVLAPNFRKKGPRAAWIYSDNWAGADTILDCFGLTLNDVINEFGNVSGHERKILDLDEIVGRMVRS